MKNRWSEDEASHMVARYGTEWGEDLSLRTYTSRLIGAEKGLVLYGGGNTSVKSVYTNILGESIPAIFIKASGHDLSGIEPEGHTGLDVDYLKKLRVLSDLSDEEMINEFRTHLFNYKAATPSLETLVHAFIPKKYIDHTHPDTILTLTNQSNTESLIKEALGEDIGFLEYIKPGFGLAKAVADVFESNPSITALILMHHGLMTWGETAHESYEKTIELVTRAEEYISKKSSQSWKVISTTELSTAEERYTRIAPILRGMLAEKTGNDDRPYYTVILKSLITRDILDLVDSEMARDIALTPPLTTDYLIRTKAFPLWIDEPDYDNTENLRKDILEAISKYSDEYEAYIKRNAKNMESGLILFDSRPRVTLMPGLGAICVGKDVFSAKIARDITSQTLAVKASIAKMGTYQGLDEKSLFDMEYRSYQHAKLGEDELSLCRQVALVTGSAGAIGSGICKELLEQGCHVALTDLPGNNLNSLFHEFKPRFEDRVIAVPMDVTDTDSIANGFKRIIQTWGGADIVVANAGIAMVSSLIDMSLDNFRRLERVNVEGTLFVLSEAARHFKLQGTGGDIVLISTKNVFAPGAKFGAYSATKAASHQLARIASLELAEMGVRVNMVSPDAVFSEGKRKSGLWEEIGPDRMHARGLDEKGLEEYYRNRNLLKARITANHVAKAVLFFATRQTPSTGATIPVDGGLPDATPR